jgi:putative flippase GtrA
MANVTETTPKTNFLNAMILSIAGRFGNKSKEVERFLKFAVVGAIGFVVDMTTLIILQATILPPVNRTAVFIATTIAFIAAILSNFTWNRFWTYPDSRSRSIRRQLAQFAFISVVGWMARTLWITLAFAPMGAFLVGILGPALAAGTVVSPTDEARIGSAAAQFIGVIVIMFWNFFANRYWTYNDVD